jgi:23S rRNA (uridine2552-2'-O)-methyltransferase
MRDKLSIKAKKQGYRARSVFKLFEINQKYQLIKRADHVLDLGSFPGSWLQASLKLVKKEGKVTGIDLKEIKKLQAEFIKADILDDKIFDLIKQKYDVILSDLAPKTSGIKDIDQEKSYLLSKRALEIAKKFLKKRGNFLCKTFQSEKTPLLVKEIKKQFFSVKTFKPKTSKKRSKEIYIIAKGKK